MTVLVVVPTYRTPPEMLDRCMTSILAQTHSDLCLLVLGDGEVPTLPSTAAMMRFSPNSRVVLHTLEENRGRYFADAVAQRATPFDWYAPHDADDWSEPDRLENLWSMRGAGVVWSDYMNHEPGAARPVRMTFPRATRPLGPEQKRVACHLGLYRIDRLRKTGMYHPDFRVHYDSLHNSLVRMTGPVSVHPKAQYHRVRWNGSMTRQRSIGLGSSYRRRAAARTRTMYRHTYELYANGRSDEIAGYIASTIEPETLDAVDYEAERLRQILI